MRFKKMIESYAIFTGEANISVFISLQFWIKKEEKKRKKRKIEALASQGKISEVSIVVVFHCKPFLL